MMNVITFGSGRNPRWEGRDWKQGPSGGYWPSDKRAVAVRWRKGNRRGVGGERCWRGKSTGSALSCKKKKVSALDTSVSRFPTRC